MSRATIHISVPRTMRTYVEARVAASGYGTVSEYFRELVREDRRRQINIRNVINRQRTESPPRPLASAVRRP